ncbi:MAG: FRG domain-containing protein [Oscillospiraceae bacterium]
MPYKELNIDNLVEIDSVSSFISEVKTLRDSANGTSTELYFRGQEAEFWDIEPSVFRNDMLSIEQKLMQIPLQKIPMEFKGLSTMFDIMTKYQHYGMCTRLLDLTTNPLVALFFACQIHGNEEYESEEGNIKKEPYGVIYYTNNYYPSQSTDKEVKIVSALASYDLSKENTVGEVLERLRENQIIDKETKERWLQKEHLKEFINIIQNNYMVTPTYTNERLRKQSGVFLLASLFSIVPGSEIKNSIITKAKGNLREEFSEKYFYIRGEKRIYT